METSKVILSQYATTGNITWDGSYYAVNDAANVAGYLDIDKMTFTANTTTSTITVGSDAYSKNWNIIGSTNTTQISGGDGADTLTAANATAVLSGGAGKDLFASAAGSLDAGNQVTIKDFTYGEDAVSGNTISGTTVSAFSSNGVIVTNGSASTNNTVKLTASNNYYKVTMNDGTNKQNVWFGGTASATMDGSAETSSLVMIGSDNTTVGDMVLGGSKSDTIFAGVNDSVYGGAGADTIYATNNSVTVGLSSTSGADSVSGFGFGFTTTENAGNSTVYLVDNAISSAKLSYTKSGNVTVKDGSGSLSLATGSSEDWQNVMVQDSTKTYKVSVAATNGTIAVDKAANYADVFVGGGNSAISFNGYALDGADGVVVDLGNTNLYGDTHAYSAITKVIGSTGNDKLIGAASTKDSLVGGNGNSSLWGGGSAADTLHGGTGTNAFFYGTGDGKDVIENFTKNDEIAFLSGTVTDMTRTNTELKLKLDFADTLTVKTNGLTAASDKINVNVNGTDYVAEIGLTSEANQFTYDSKVDFYYGSTKTDTVNYTGTDNANIWLDGSQGAQFSSVEDIDASSSTADLQLAGNTAANKITGGKGTTSLWGGVGKANDTLVGGSGENAFYFGMSEGNDVITSSNSTDKVMLYNVASSSIASASVSGGAMNIALTDGSTLKISNYTSNSVNTFVLSDATYTYDATAKTWTKTA